MDEEKKIFRSLLTDKPKIFKKSKKGKGTASSSM